VAKYLDVYRKLVALAISEGAPQESIEALRRTPFVLPNRGPGYLIAVRQALAKVGENRPAELDERRLRAALRGIAAAAVRRHWPTVVDGTPLQDQARVTLEELARHMRERGWTPFEMRVLASAGGAKPVLAVVCERFADVAPRSRPALQPQLAAHFGSVLWLTSRELRWAYGEDAARVESARPVRLARP
jgi:hypothetical protein